jgi:SnoaL-like domain
MRDIEEEVRELRNMVQHMKDRQDILDCILREARGRDRHDAELIASCYWNDGVDEHGPLVTPAPDYPLRANAGHAAAFAANSHNITNHNCEIDGDVATCESYVIGGLLSLDCKTCKIVPGRYIDRLERRNGEWRIVVRRTVIDMAVEGDASWLESLALQGFLKGLRSKADPSYQRPVRPDPEGERW